MRLAREAAEAGAGRVNGMLRDAGLGVEGVGGGQQLCDAAPSQTSRYKTLVSPQCTSGTLPRAAPLRDEAGAPVRTELDQQLLEPAAHEAQRLQLRLGLRANRGAAQSH